MIWVLSLVEITAFRLESKSYKGFFKINFPPLRALKIMTGHVIYNPASTYKFRSKTTFMTPDVIEKAIVQYSPPKFSNS